MLRPPWSFAIRWFTMRYPNSLSVRYGRFPSRSLRVSQPQYRPFITRKTNHAVPCQSLQREPLAVPKHKRQKGNVQFSMYKYSLTYRCEPLTPQAPNSYHSCGSSPSSRNMTPLLCPQSAPPPSPALSHGSPRAHSQLRRCPHHHTARATVSPSGSHPRQRRWRRHWQPYQ